MMESVFAIAVVKNEDDIIQYTIDNLLTQGVDHFFIANNMSTDNTYLILDSFNERYPGRFSIFDDNEPGHYHSRKMNALMDKAVAQGADIILPFDADEIWLSCSDMKVAEVLRRKDCDVHIATVYNMVGKPDTGNVLVDMCWREPVVKSLPSVAFRWQEGCRISEGNHEVFHSGIRVTDSLYVRHYQYRSLNQLKRKVRDGKKAYELTDLPDAYGSHWKVKASMSDLEIERDWSDLISQPNLIYDPFMK